MKNRSHRYDIKRLSSRHGHKYSRYKNSLTMMMLISGVDPEILKGGALYVSYHGWPTKKLLGFKWSKKAKITLETKSFS